MQAELPIYHVVSIRTNLEWSKHYHSALVTVTWVGWAYWHYVRHIYITAISTLLRS